MIKHVWVRVGDGGEYEPFSNLDAAVDYLNELNVGSVSGWIDAGPGIGFETPNYHGYHFISFYWGDCHADLIRPFNKAERTEVESRLAEACI